jgi:hypothetical protein
VEKEAQLGKGPNPGGLGRGQVGKRSPENKDGVNCVEKGEWKSTSRLGTEGEI